MTILLVINLNNKNISGKSIITTKFPLTNFLGDPTIDLKYIVRIYNSKHTNSPIITSIRYTLTSNIME